tara:strand:- start:174 stop:1265 length:1092 start_codon:yes stop_codon:yes gene_type:complete
MTDINTELEQIADEEFVDDTQLDEASADAPKKGAAPAEKGDKLDGEVQDMGPAVVSPDAKSDPGKEAAKKEKKASPPTTKSSDASAKMEEVEEDDDVIAEAPEVEEAEEESIAERVAAMDLSDDVSALTETDGLEEEFKKKAATIFEAAIRMKLKEEMTHLEEKYEAKLATQIEEAQEEMAEKVDDYLNYVVEEWMKKNEVAMEHKLKGEIAEGFMTGLKVLFEQHNISVPEEQFDMLDAASEKVAELEDKLNEALEQNIALTKTNADLQRTDILLDVASDLADTEVEKFAGLTENIEYTSEEDFREKVETIKEGYFPKAQATTPSDDTAAPVEGTEEIDVSDVMGAYMSAISRTHIRGKAEA